MGKDKLRRYINKVLKLALDDGQLTTALKAIELLAKLFLDKNSYKIDLKSLTNEELDEMIQSVKDEIKL